MSDDLQKRIDDLNAEVASLTADRDKWKAMSRQNEDAKKAAVKELADAKAEHTQAIADATDAAKAEAVKESAGKVALTAFKAAAKGRVADVDAVLENVDVARFATETGDPNEEAITKFLDGIAPANKPDGKPSSASFDGLFTAQGARPVTGGGMDLNGDPLYQKIKSAIGIPD